MSTRIPEQVSTRATFNGNTSTLHLRLRCLQAIRLHDGITVTTILTAFAIRTLLSKWPILFNNITYFKNHPPSLIHQYVRCTLVHVLKIIYSGFNQKDAAIVHTGTLKMAVFKTSATVHILPLPPPSFPHIHLIRDTRYLNISVNTLSHSYLLSTTDGITVARFPHSLAHTYFEQQHNTCASLPQGGRPAGLGASQTSIFWGRGLRPKIHTAGWHPSLSHTPIAHPPHWGSHSPSPT